MSDVDRIRATTEAFRSWDNEHGSGLSRDAVAQLCATATLLRHGRTSDAVGRTLFSAIADLASVAGWTTHDVGRHAESQQGFLLGLQAAKEADDQEIAGHLLNCMARQASHLRRVDDALELLEFAHYGTRLLPDGRLRAVLTAFQAHCLAVMGDLRGFQRSPGLTRRSNRRRPPVRPVVRRSRVRRHHRRQPSHRRPTRTNACRTGGDADQRSVSTRAAARVRSRAFDPIALARAHLAAGDVDATGEVTAQVLELTDAVSSTRVRDCLLEPDSELAAQKSPYAQRVRQRVSEAAR